MFGLIKLLLLFGFVGCESGNPVGQLEDVASGHLPQFLLEFLAHLVRVLDGTIQDLDVEEDFHATS